MKNPRFLQIGIWDFFIDYLKSFDAVKDFLFITLKHNPWFQPRVMLSKRINI